MRVTVAPGSLVLTPARALELAHGAADVAGLAHDRAELIRLGSNGIVRLPGRVVARVARDESWAPIAQLEVRVAGEFHSAGVPCARPWPINQPIYVQGHPVTFWEEIPGPHTRATAAEMGTVLRKFHDADTRVELPPLDPWGHTPERIEQVTVGFAQRRILRDVLAEVQDGWTNARFVLDAGPIHGDAHLGNLVHDANGNTVLIDFDSVCVGPREWDLAPTALYATSLGWIDRGEYEKFVSAYGFDVTTEPVFQVLTRMRELRMTAWMAMHATESERTATELAHRIDCLADPELPRHWSPR
jgi:Ser/Thr protein kinase RdoA (MazF antagonist)